MADISTLGRTPGRSVEKDENRRASALMLALSTFRRSDRATELAIEKAAEGRDLVIVYVADVNLALLHRDGHWVVS